MYHVYILQSGKTFRYYIGSTQDVTNRLEEHNRCECASTRAGIPWTMIRVEDFETRAEAMAQEKRIKSRGAGRYLASLRKAQPG